MIDIFNLQPNKITTNLNQYSIVITCPTGLGKTTAMKSIAESVAPEGKKPLFICTEKRFAHIPGIMAQFVKNYSEIMQIKTQLMNPKAQEIFSCVIFDTADRLDAMIEKYNADNKGVQITGDLGFGKGNKYIKSSIQFINEIRSAGWLTHFIVQSEISKDIVTGVETQSLCGLNKEIWRLISQDAFLIGNLSVDSKDERWLTFKRSNVIPFLKDSIGMPAKLKVSDFKKEFEKAVTKMAGGMLTDEDTITGGMEDTRDFETIKNRGNELGNILANNGFLDEAMFILAQNIGTDEDGNPKMFDSLLPSQIDLADVVVQQLETLAKSKELQV